MPPGHLAFLPVLFALASAVASEEVPLRDFHALPEDLVVPAAVDAPPAAGRRVRLSAPGFEGSAAHHTLYLPADWEPGRKYAVLVEYAGNGGYANPKLGDSCDGSVEGCHLGYGLSEGRGFIWLCLPYVELADGAPRNATKWWGDVDQSIRYALAALDQTSAKFGGDPAAVVLCGFSRGSIGCNYLGLHDDRIAPRWRAFFCYSHYDGVRTGWPYAGADRASALERLKRLRGRPQFICMERSTKETEDYLRETGVEGDFTFVPIPFPNHNDRWVLRNIPERKQARDWLARVIGGSPAR